MGRRRAPDRQRLSSGRQDVTSVVRKLRAESGYVTAATIPNQGATDIYGNTFTGLPGNKLALGAVATAELGELGVTTSKLAEQAVASGKIANLAVITDKLAGLSVSQPKIVDGAISTLKLEGLAVTQPKIAAGAINAEKIEALAVGTAEVKDAAITSIKIAANAVRNSELALDAVGGGNIQAGAVGAGKIDNALNNPAQGNHGLRTIGGNGNNLSAAASDHSHGSGNSLDFDYLPATIQERVFLARTRVRQNVGLIPTMTDAQLKLYLRELAIVASVALTLQIDAPDLKAEERKAMRDRGEQFGEFFEHRRAHVLDSPDGVLHERTLRHYQAPPPEIAEVIA